MLVAEAMIALSIFFVFRPHRSFTGIQPPHQLAVTTCEASPEAVTMPPKRGCEETMTGGCRSRLVEAPTVGR